VSLSKHIKIAKRNSTITPRLMGWLSSHGEVKLEDPVTTERVLQILAPSDHDRSGVFHPSQLYECERKQLFEFDGLPKLRRYDPTLQNLFNDGHFRHLRWQVMLLNAGILTDIEVAVSIPELRLAGSMDGANFVDGWMFELKGTSQFNTVMQKGAMPAHIQQVHAYLLASGLEKAIIVYEDKSSQQWQEIEVIRDEEKIEEILSILKRLNTAIDSDQLPEMLDECKNQTGRFARCPYATVCSGFERRSEVVEAVAASRGIADGLGDEG